MALASCFPPCGEELVSRNGVPATWSNRATTPEGQPVSIEYRLKTQGLHRTHNTKLTIGSLAIEMSGIGTPSYVIEERKISQQQTQIVSYERKQYYQDVQPWSLSEGKQEEAARLLCNVAAKEHIAAPSLIKLMPEEFHWLMDLVAMPCPFCFKDFSCDKIEEHAANCTGCHDQHQLQRRQSTMDSIAEIEAATAAAAAAATSPGELKKEASHMGAFQCPLCFQDFPVGEIEDHAAACTGPPPTPPPPPMSAPAHLPPAEPTATLPTAATTQPAAVEQQHQQQPDDSQPTCHVGMTRTASSSARYEVRNELLGKGTFGRVNRGYDFFGGGDIAVKLNHLGESNEKTIKALQTEFDMLKTLRHPNIVQVLHFDVMDGEARIFMEWASRGTVSSQIAKSQAGRLHEYMVRKMAKEALQGLEYLHGLGIIHRDIKPANMLVGGDGAVKISDFGTAKNIIERSQNASATRGTVPYMPKEAVMEMVHTPAMDIWAMACSIVEMASGELPFSHLGSHLNHMTLMFQIANGGKPQIPPHVSSELRQILEECFNVEYKSRPSAKDLLNRPYFRSEELPPDAEDIETFRMLANNRATTERGENSDGSGSFPTSIIVPLNGAQ